MVVTIMMSYSTRRNSESKFSESTNHKDILEVLKMQRTVTVMEMECLDNTEHFNLLSNHSLYYHT